MTEAMLKIATPGKERRFLPKNRGDSAMTEAGEKIDSGWEIHPTLLPITRGDSAMTEAGEKIATPEDHWLLHKNREDLALTVRWW